jgi:hypothetical protein
MAKGRYYFLMTSLPTLAPLGEAPPVSLERFRGWADEEPGLAEPVEAVLLEHDLLLRQSALTGESEEVSPLVLTAAQAAGEAPLPAPLRVESDQPGRVEDAVWAAYFRYVDSVGRDHGVEFLIEWTGFEVALRNALVAARAKVLELNADEYIVAPELADPTAEVEATVAQWAGADDPLAAQRALDQGRWEWLDYRSRPFSFGADEPCAYARALVLLDRWRRVSQGLDAQPSVETNETQSP